MSSLPDIPRHPQDVELSWEALTEALGALEGSRVAVRIVEPGDPETLVVVFRGELASLRHDRPPTAFWPVTGPFPPAPDETEESGIYLQRDRFGGAYARVDGRILVIMQGSVVVNVRRL